MAFTLTSPAFANNETIPYSYACDGSNISPPLVWHEAPVNTKSFALIMQDPDAPNGTWDHWILFNIPSAYSQLQEGLKDHIDKMVLGKNSWGKNTYGGPCPPSGTHRYYFTLYALDTLLDLKPGSDKKALLKAMQGHVLAQAELMGHYARR